MDKHRFHPPVEAGQKPTKLSLGAPPSKKGGAGVQPTGTGGSGRRQAERKPSIGIPDTPNPAGPAISSEFEITSYGSSGDMDAVLLTASGAFQAAAQAVELDSRKEASAPPSGSLDLDWESLPTHLRRGAPPKMGSAAERAPSLAPLAEMAAVKPKPSTAPAGEVSQEPEFHAIDVRKPKVGVLLMAVLLIGGGVGLMFYKRHAMEVAAAEVRSQIDAFNAQRAPLYEALRASATQGTPIQSNFCPRLGDVSDDTTFVFSGDAIIGFPTEHRGSREMARYEAYLDEEFSREIFAIGNEALERVGNAVAFVRIQSWRRPRVSAQLQTANSYTGFASGYVIGDAYVGDAQTGREVCSFRFFANSSPSVRAEVSPEVDTANDLLAQVYSALNSGLRGVRAVPGAAGGRYEPLQPPTGF